MAKSAAIIITIFLTGCGFHSWKVRDKALFTTYTVGNMIDILQTREIKRDENEYYEINPVLDGLSRDQATGVMVSTNVAFGFVADWAGERWRALLLVGANGIKWSFVIHNHSIGIRGKW